MSANVSPSFSPDGNLSGNLGGNLGGNASCVLVADVDIGCAQIVMPINFIQKY